MVWRCPTAHSGLLAVIFSSMMSLIGRAGKSACAAKVFPIRFSFPPGATHDIHCRAEKAIIGTVDDPSRPSGGDTGRSCGGWLHRWSSLPTGSFIPPTVNLLLILKGVDRRECRANEAAASAVVPQPTVQLQVPAMVWPNRRRALRAGVGRGAVIRRRCRARPGRNCAGSDVVGSNDGGPRRRFGAGPGRQGGGGRESFSFIIRFSARGPR